MVYSTSFVYFHGYLIPCCLFPDCLFYSTLFVNRLFTWFVVYFQTPSTHGIYILFPIFPATPQPLEDVKTPLGFEPVHFNSIDFNEPLGPIDYQPDFLHSVGEDGPHASPSDQSSVSSPVLSPTGIRTPQEGFNDAPQFNDVNTQMSLCERSAKLQLEEGTCLSLFGLADDEGEIQWWYWHCYYLQSKDWMGQS